MIILFLVKSWKFLWSHCIVITHCLYVLLFISTEIVKWFDEANNMMKSTWIKNCKRIASSLYGDWWEFWSRT